jgi:hypothetical protein
MNMQYGNLTRRKRNKTAINKVRPIIPLITGIAGFKFLKLYPCAKEAYFIYLV